jgi:hypothetical protein
MKAKLLVILILVLCEIAGCKQDTRKNENLPEGMAGGIWHTLSAEMVVDMLVFFDDGYVADNRNRYDSYQLVNDNTLLFENPAYTTLAEVSISESGQQVIMTHETGSTKYHLFMPDSSTGNLEREIVGKWFQIHDLSSFNWSSNKSAAAHAYAQWEFTDNGGLLISQGTDFDLDDGDAIIATYSWVGEEVVAEYGSGIDETFSVSSIGDILFLHSSDVNVGIFLVRDSLVD